MTYTVEVFGKYTNVFSSLAMALADGAEQLVAYRQTVNVYAWPSGNLAARLYPSPA